jgi:hypothetical protein
VRAVAIVVQATGVAADTVRRGRKEATDRGIYILQQRIVKHYTRFEVDIPSLAKETKPVLWEMHEQRDWVETVLDNEADWTTENLSTEETAFDAWLLPATFESLIDPANRDRPSELTIASGEYREYRPEILLATG